MSGEIEKLSREDYVQRLAALERRLQVSADDEVMLADLSVAMRALLAEDSDSEADIRTTMQRQFAAGNLRAETFELVQNMLGKIATEEMVRAPLPGSTSMADEVFAATAVIEDQAQVQAAAQAPPKAPPAPVAEAQVGAVLRDRFLLQERLAEGSMGVVYKALDRRLAEAGEGQCSVAIKMLSPELAQHGTALRALQQEAAKGRCLTHPNIVRFIDLDREGDLYFIVMEWLDGHSLSKILDESASNALDIGTALNIVGQAGRALDYAHQRGVIHADVKPGNIIVTTTGEVKLIDFGIARVRQKENEGKKHFDPGVMSRGTPAYSSMQVLTGEDPVATDDVFSLACLFYRLVAGYRVYGPRNAAQAAEEGMEPQRPQQLSATQWQTVKKALSYSRVTRFESPKAFVAALRTAFAHVQPVAEPVAPVSQEETSQETHVPDIRKQKGAPPVSPASEPPGNQSVPVQNELPQPGRDYAAPIRAGRESIMYEEDEEEPRRSFFGIVLFALFAAGLGYIATQTDLVDRIGKSIETMDVAPIAAFFEEEVFEAEVFKQEAEIVDAPYVDESLQDIAEFVPQETLPDGGDIDSPAETETVVTDELLVVDNNTDIDGEIERVQEPVVVENLIDWSALPSPTAMITLAASADESDVVTLAIREDGDAAIVDFLRGDATAALDIVIEETGYSGNRSPLAAGQYSLDNDGRIQFAAGQDRARLTISMRSNPVREADRDVTLTVRNTSNELAVATVELTLEDDDQRAFEDSLPPNTVAFAVNQISVREFDPAAQVDVIRYRADNSALEVPYELVDVTASEGQDYFAPDIAVVYFAPGQRTARILIPLGQDSRAEEDEAFLLELDTEATAAGAKVFSQVAVVIRDDDS